MNNVYDITNHVDYTKHMDDFIHKDKVNVLLQKYITEAAQKKQTFEQLKDIIAKQQVAIGKCPKLPKPDICANRDIKNHPEYIKVINLLKKITDKPKQCTNSKIEKAQTKLNILKKKCGMEIECKPCKTIKHINEPIEQHPHFNKLVRELHKKGRSHKDIRNHPDYAYFKAFYIRQIEELSSQLNKVSKKVPDPLLPIVSMAPAPAKVIKAQKPYKAHKPSKPAPIRDHRPPSKRAPMGISIPIAPITHILSQRRH